ncbi:MAG: Macrolide export protein MacA [Pelotomaculum sp. PtaU1.Bin035]|nr:MAG: Macrolide export protein MacA [Pelotomaculum sp. PtaU1.Bin035]
MKKRVFFIVAVLLAAGLLLTSGCGINPNNKDAGGNGPVAAETFKARMGIVGDGATVSGKLEALESAVLVPKIAGKVATINVDIGSKVSAGDVLLTLDAKELAAAMGQAEAAVALARSAREQAQASLELARADYEVAQSNFERGKLLMAQGAISQSDFDNKFALLYRNSEARYRLAREQAGSGVDAQYSQALAALQLARANYANSIITSPISGVVTAKNIKLGEMASTSSQVLSVDNLDKVVVVASVGESQVNQLTEGQEVEVKIAVVSNGLFTGKITNISYAANQLSKSYPVKIQIENPGHVLKPGMFAEVRLPGSGAEVLMVPREAVSSKEGKQYVFVVENGLAKKSEVSCGKSDGKNIMIVSGLKVGDEVVVSGVEDIQEGTRIAVKPAGS